MLTTVHWTVQASVQTVQAGAPACSPVKNRGKSEHELVAVQGKKRKLQLRTCTHSGSRAGKSGLIRLRSLWLCRISSIIICLYAQALIKGSNFARFPALTASGQEVAQCDISPARVLTSPGYKKRAQTYPQASSSFHHTVRGSSAHSLLHQLTCEDSLALEVHPAAPTPNPSEASVNAAASPFHNVSAKGSDLGSQPGQLSLHADSVLQGGAAWQLQAVRLDAKSRCFDVFAFVSSLGCV